MSEYWYNEEYEYSPEPEIEIPDGAGELTVKLSLNAGQIEAAVQQQLNVVFEAKLKQMIRKKVSESMANLLGDKYWAAENMKKVLREIVQERLDRLYPEVTENKVNEFAEHIKNMKFAEIRNGEVSDIQTKAKKRVEDYINSELAESVKLSKDYIEQFAKNYFANNLFRAMGMMDKMIPQTEDSKHLNK